MLTRELMKEEVASRKTHQLQQKEPWRTGIRKKTTHKKPRRQDTYVSIAMYFHRFNGPKMLLPLGDPFLLWSSSKSTQRRSKRWK